MTKKQRSVHQETVVAYKGFDSSWQCRGFQYEAGKDYTHDGEAVACESGFHACEYPFDVFTYYAPAGSKLAVVEQSGKLVRHEGDSKIASTKIKIKAEIDIADLVNAAIEYTTSRCKSVDPESPASATGERGAAYVTGWSGAASATGESGAASATGWRGAASATGKHSVAMACGFEGKAKASNGCAIFLVERKDDGEIINVFAGIAGRDGIKPDVFYMLKGGNLVEV